MTLTHFLDLGYSDSAISSAKRLLHLDDTATFRWLYNTGSNPSGIKPSGSNSLRARVG